MTTSSATTPRSGSGGPPGGPGHRRRGRVHRLGGPDPGGLSVGPWALSRPGVRRAGGHSLPPRSGVGAPARRLRNVELARRRGRDAVEDGTQTFFVRLPMIISVLGTKKLGRCRQPAFGPAVKPVKIPLVDLASMHAEIDGEGGGRLLGASSPAGHSSRAQQVTAFEEARRRLQRWCGTASAWRTARTPSSLRSGPSASVRRRGHPACQHVHRHGRGSCPGRATPVLVDCDPEFLLIDPDAVARRGSGPGPRRSSRCTCSARQPRSSGSPASPGTSGSPWSRTTPQSTALPATAYAAGQPPRRPRRPASTRARTLGAYGDGGAVLTDSDEGGGRACVPSATMAAPCATSIPSSVSTPVSTASRRSCSRPSWPDFPPGTGEGPPPPSATRSCSGGSPASRCPPRCPATPMCGTSTSCASTRGLTVATPCSPHCCGGRSAPVIHIPGPGPPPSSGASPDWDIVVADFPRDRESGGEHAVASPVPPREARSRSTTWWGSSRRHSLRCPARRRSSSTRRACVRVTPWGPARGSGPSPRACGGR